MVNGAGRGRRVVWVAAAAVLAVSGSGFPAVAQTPPTRGPIRR